MLSDSDRIKEIIKVKGLNNAQFCALTGISAATLSHITGGRQNPTVPIFRTIIRSFPDISPLWIYEGIGDMYVADGSAADGTSVADQVQSDGSPAANVHDAAPAPSLFAAGTNPASSVVINQTKNTGVQPDAQAVSASRTAQPMSLFDSPAFVEQQTARSILADVVREALVQDREVHPVRQITEIRVFFDDGTYESFAAKK